MRKLAGVLAMSTMLLLASCGGNQAPVTKVYTSANNGQTITIPASVATLTLLSGQGAPGTPQQTYDRYYFSKKTTTYNQRNDQGGVVYELDGGTTYEFGVTPADYCTNWEPYFVNGVTNYTRTCYDYTNLDHQIEEPATTGAAATMTGPNGFSRTFPGGAGGPATPQSFSNVAVVPGGQYVLTIPANASISISYYE